MVKDYIYLQMASTIKEDEKIAYMKVKDFINILVEIILKENIKIIIEKAKELLDMQMANLKLDYGGMDNSLNKN